MTANGSMKLYIKNMISPRCIREVKAELEKLGIKYTFVGTGELITNEKISAKKLKELKIALRKCGFELVDKKKSLLLERALKEVAKIVDNSTRPPKAGFSKYISKKLNYDHTHIADLFTEVKGITLELFIIANKVEKVKEVLVYDDLTLAEISEKFHFDGVPHLAGELKKVTGLTPSHFKQIRNKRSKPRKDQK